MQHDSLDALLASLYPGPGRPSPEPHESLFHALLRDHPGRAPEIAAVHERMYGRRLDWLPGSGALSAAISSRHPAMSDALVAGLDLCAGHGLATGWRELSTTTVFQVYRWSQPWIVAALPDGALREVEPEWSGQSADIFTSGALLSACVRASLAGLCRTAPPGASVTFHDLFFDLARFGAGRSVGRLREVGVGQEELLAWARRLGIGLRTRHGPLAAASAEA